jgi:hypothetical protein
VKRKTKTKEKKYDERLEHIGNLQERELSILKAQSEALSRIVWKSK